MKQTLQTAIKIFIAMIIGLLAFQAFRIAIGGLIFVTKGIFLIGLCLIAYVVVNTVWGGKSATS